MERGLELKEKGRNERKRNLQLNTRNSYLTELPSGFRVLTPRSTHHDIKLILKLNDQTLGNALRHFGKLVKASNNHMLLTNHCEWMNYLLALQCSCCVHVVVFILLRSYISMKKSNDRILELR